MDDDDNPVRRPGETDNEFGARQVQSLNDAARDYWQKMAAEGAALPDAFESPGRNRRSPRQPREIDMAKPPSPSPPAINPDDINPLALIVEALRNNTDATQAALAEAKATHQAMAESEKLANRLADGAAKDVRNLVGVVSNMTVSQAELDRAKIHNVYWGAAGFVAGVILTAAGVITWQHMFG